ncbi:hypothetical protein ANN_04724 [Periplaneta americana]|uniref:RNase H type-1 domain-containing protein n=1 Tax=Periplaneta americana TaxID=6978 RepID=A0ABQ8TAT2_PERAM|nr:hypothetical protein ANN_04724 [Periplaneta americana]
MGVYGQEKITMTALREGEMSIKLEVHTKEDIKKLNKIVHLQWIPSHCGIAGNEAADFLAKKGTTIPLSYSDMLPFHRASTNISSRVRQCFHKSLEDQIKDKHWKDALNSTLPKWPRREAVATVRTAVGHDCLANHLHLLGVLTSPHCMLCGCFDTMDSNHIKTCPALSSVSFIASVLGSSSTILKPELIKLLRDDAEEVLQGLVPRLGQTMVLLSKAGSFSPEFMVSRRITVVSTRLRLLSYEHVCQECERKLKKPAPIRANIRMLVNKFKRAESFLDEKHSGRPQTSANDVPLLQHATECSPGTSTRCLSNELDIPRTTVWRVLRFTLHKLVYHPQVLHHLEQEDYAAHQGMCHDLLEAVANENLMNHILLSDEATFHTCDRVSRITVEYEPTSNLMLLTNDKGIHPELLVYTACFKNPQSLDKMDTTVLDVGRALLKCETEISMTTNWRLHAMILGQLECLPHCMPSDFIHSHFIPVIFNRIHVARPVPCRMAAARTMLVFLRYNIKQTQKSAIRSRIDTDLRNSDSCYKRMLFVKMCATAMDLFSRRYFKEYFFMSLIGLSEDRVPNIRLKLVTMLPKLKAMLSLPADRKLLTSLEACIRNLLLLEKDRDVMAQLRITIQALDAIEVRMDVSGTVPATTKEDIEDQKKAEEEAKLCAGIVPAGKRKAAGNQMDIKGISDVFNGGERNWPPYPIISRLSCFMHDALLVSRGSNLSLDS